MPGVLEYDQGLGDDWEALILKHSNEDPIAFIEKNPVVDGEIGAEEVQEFIEEVMHYQPASAAKWLSNYLPDVQVIYSFQLLSGTDVNDGWGILPRYMDSSGIQQGVFCKLMARVLATKMAIRFYGNSQKG